MIMLKVAECSFSVLRELIVEYWTVQTMREKLRDEVEKTVFSSEVEKIIEWHNTVSCSEFLRDAASVLKEQISETMDDKFIPSFHKRQIFSYITNAKIGINACFDVKRHMKCSRRKFAFMESC